MDSFKRDLLYFIEPKQYDEPALRALLEEHPEIKFVSFMGVDFAGNDTDEKIPIALFLSDMESLLHKHAAQTDGSSVVLPGIATLNNARVDMVADLAHRWYVDYNYEHIDEVTGKMVGTLRIPCFLLHDGVYVDSRSILQNVLSYVGSELKALLQQYPHLPGLEHINGAEVEEVLFTNATELEFWVKSPREAAPIEALSSSQMLQEQYWARTRGNVRTALEQAVEVLGYYGLEPEMGHKECGGIRGQMDNEGHMTHVMEQLEIDWKYSSGVQAADNELLARIIVKEVFRQNGLEVSFQAKPIQGVAGSGEHVHVGLAARLSSGKIVNLMAPQYMEEDFLSAIGYGSIMGILKNYEVINPFISATNDAFNRLKPGFEAPVCIVTSLGISPHVPSRNRTILAGLVRDIDNPKATRIEMRSPNPYTNTYLAIAVFYMAALDGIKACAASGKNLKELEKELSKEAGEEGFYLETERKYRTEENVFDDFTALERAQLFGEPPATVWENMNAFRKYPEKLAVLTRGDIIKPVFVDSFAQGALIRWQTELLNKLLTEGRDMVRSAKKLHTPGEDTTYDDKLWAKIKSLRIELAKDTEDSNAIFTLIKQAADKKDYEYVSLLQEKMMEKVEELEQLYHIYSNNMLD